MFTVIYKVLKNAKKTNKEMERKDETKLELEEE